MRQIDVAHQSENQGKAAGDKEIEAGQSQAVQAGAEKGLF